MEAILGFLAFVAIIATAIAPSPDLFSGLQSAWLGRQWESDESTRAINADYTFQYLVTKQPDLPGFYLLLLAERGPLEGRESYRDEVCKHDVGFEINEESWRTFCRPRVIAFTPEENGRKIRMHLSFTGINEEDPKCRLEIPIHGIESEEYSSDPFFKRRDNHFDFVRVSPFLDVRPNQRIDFKFEWFANLLNHGVIEKGIDPQTGLEVFESRPILMMSSSVGYLGIILMRDID